MIIKTEGISHFIINFGDAAKLYTQFTHELDIRVEVKPQT